MINAWSLLYEELNGTMDKTYPVENNELNDEDIVINTGTGNTIFNVPEDLEVEEVDPNMLNPAITFGGSIKLGSTSSTSRSSGTLKIVFPVPVLITIFSSFNSLFSTE